MDIKNKIYKIFCSFLSTIFSFIHFYHDAFFFLLIINFYKDLEKEMSKVHSKLNKSL